MRHVDANEAMKDFNQEQATLFNIKWKNFDLNNLHEFSVRWKSRAEQICSTTFAEKMLKKLTTIDNILPTLKYCCGVSYKDEHWEELLHDVLCVPRHISAKAFTCNELIEASDKLLLPDVVILLQELQTRYVFRQNVYFRIDIRILTLILILLLS